MDIKVLRKNKGIFVKQNTVEINFKKFNCKRDSRKIPTIVAYDTQGDFIPVSLNLIHMSSRIPSTLLSRWINANCSEKLLTLKDRCQSEEWVVNGVNKGWMFVKKDCMLYGLHKISVVEHTVSGCDNHTVVQIDDSVGMQSVLKIATELNLEVFCNFDHKAGNMSSIKLTGVI